MLENLSAFITVVENQSLNRAAHIMNLSQPALSRRILKLEEELDVQLFLRKGKRLELTRIGQIVYEHAMEMRTLEFRMMKAVNKYKSTDNGSITLGASLTTLQSTLPELIGLYTKDYPQTDIKALTGKTHEIVNLVLEKKVDLGLVASEVSHAHLHCVPLFNDHLRLVMHREHPLAPNRELKLSDLHHLPMILFSKGTWYRILTDDFFQRYSILPDVKMEIDSFEAIIRLISTIGVAALLPNSYLLNSLMTNNRLVARNIRELEETKRTTSLLYRDLDTLNAAAVLLIEKAEAHFQHGL